MFIETLSTFPHMYDSVMGESMMKRAQEKGLLEFRAHDLRHWTHDRHRTTDDDPYGGGAGLVAEAAPKLLSQRRLDRAGDLVSAALRQGRHIAPHLFVILPREIEQQTLQVAGHQNVHGGAHGGVEGTVPVVDAGAEEICQNIVAVGCADQLPHR